MSTSLSAIDVELSEALSSTQARWQAFMARDPAADRAFVAAVRTTGIYCRASCPARRPRRENVAFYDTGEAAEAAGYRPCKRCRPDVAARDATIERACRLIEDAESPPGLDTLASAVGLSASHFHRLFKRATGVTPKAYAAAARANRLSVSLPKASSVTEAAFDAGFNAASRFYAETPGRLGMTPSAYRKGGSGTSIRFGVARCSLGAILVAATEKGICTISIGDDPEQLVRDLRQRFGEAEFAREDPAFEATVAAVVALAEAPGRRHDLPLDIRGTAFQQRVWEIMRAIPAGRTATYRDIAQAIGVPSATRAVAKACGANPLALAIPCHRVIRSDGALSGYRWGVERKRDLLAREGVTNFADVETTPRPVKT